MLKLSKLLGLSLSVGLLSVSGIAHAQDVSTVKDKEAIQNISKFIKDNNGVLKGIYDIGINGLYEVLVAPADIMYITKDADKVFIRSELIDIKKERSITQMRKDEALKIKYADLPKNNFIKFGNGKNEISVFADPNCSFCKAFEKTLESEKNLTVKVYPVAILAASSKDLNQNIMCSANPAKAWKDWMINGIKPAEVKGCKFTGIENNDYARDNGINSTPTTFFLDGHRVPGAMDSNRLNEEIKKAKEAPKTK